VAYQVTLAPAAERAVSKLPKLLRERIAQRLVALENNPRPQGCIKLAGEDAYRIRAGDYRIIYSIHDDLLLVLVIDVGHRRDVYRRR
jgi:mRNA interferase RelE/StbE